MEEVTDRAKDIEGANYSQASYMTAVRQKLRALKHSKNKFKTFSPEEQEAITALIRGDGLENFLRGLGKLAPTSPGAFFYSAGSGATVGELIGRNFGMPWAGGAVGSTALPLMGMGARPASMNMQQNKLNYLDELIRGSKSPPRGWNSPRSETITGRGVLSSAPVAMENKVLEEERMRRNAQNKMNLGVSGDSLGALK